MMRWVEIAEVPMPERFNVLSKYLNDKGLPNQVEFIKTTREEFPAVLKEAFTKYDTIRIGRGVGELAPPLFNNNTLFIQKMGACDSVVKDHGQWCLRSTLYEGLNQVCSNVGHRFELDSSALVVGAGAVARASVAALARSGFSRFAISDQSPDRAEVICEQLRKMFLGCEFRNVPKQELILLPGIFGVLVNTTPLEEGNEILGELTYFNFFRKNALAFDFTLKPVDTPLLVEAADVGVFPVRGFEIAAESDKMWIEWITDKKIDMSGYQAALEAELRKA